MHVGDQSPVGESRGPGDGGQAVPRVPRRRRVRSRAFPRASGVARAQDASRGTHVSLRGGRERVPVDGADHLHLPVRRGDHRSSQSLGHGTRGVGPPPRHRRAAPPSLAASPQRHAQTFGRERRCGPGGGSDGDSGGGSDGGSGGGSDGGVHRGVRRDPGRRLPPRVLLPGARATRREAARARERHP